MSRVNNLLSSLVNFVEKEFCEIDSQDCDCCSHYDSGNCPVYLSRQYLEEENYVDEE